MRAVTIAAIMMSLSAGGLQAADAAGVSRGELAHAKVEKATSEERGGT